MGERGPDLQSVHSAYYGVRDFGPAVRALRDGLGWAVTEFDALDEIDCEALWGVESSAEIMTMSPDPGCATGVVHLLRFDPSSTPSPRGAPPMTAYGNFGLSLYVLDTEAVVRRAVAAGARLHGEITTFQVAGPAGPISKKGAMFEFPDDVNIIVTESSEARWTWTWAHKPDAPVTEVHFFVYGAPDLDESLRWWGADGLGLPISHTAHVTTDLVAQMTGAGPGLDMTNGVTANDLTGRIEFVGPNVQLDSLDFDGREDLRNSQFPGLSLGLVLWRLVLPERPESLADWATSRHVRIERLPRRRRSPHFEGRAVGIASLPTGHRFQLEMPGC